MKKNQMNVETRATSLPVFVHFSLGAAFFLGYSREQRLQNRVHGKELTVIDALFFSTSIATSVG
jgi:hypothetical protein